MKTAQLGSVSHGTMRPEDLIPAFRDTLEDLDPKRYRKFQDEWNDKTADLAGSDEVDDERLDEMLGELFDVLDEYAPPFAHFGSHEGDGADYGFWLSWDAIDEAVRSGEVVKIDAGDEWPHEPMPPEVEYVLLVTDHGNATLKTRDGNTVWAVV